MTASTAATGLLREILDHPDEDFYRLAYADEIEATEPERSEFIRVQIELAKLPEPPRQTLTAHWSGPWAYCSECLKIEGEGKCRYHELEDRQKELWSNIFVWFPELKAEKLIPSGDDMRYYVRRGFVESITCTRRQFMGGPCQKCMPNYETENGNGLGWLLAGSSRDGYFHIECEHCHGSGRIPGLASVVGSRWPVTKINISDLVIHESTGASYFYVGGLGIFPQKYWNRLDRLPSRIDCRKAASEVCVDYMRESCGMRGIYRKEK